MKNVVPILNGTAFSTQGSGNLELLGGTKRTREPYDKLYRKMRPTLCEEANCPTHHALEQHVPRSASGTNVVRNCKEKVDLASVPSP